LCFSHRFQPVVDGENNFSKNKFHPSLSIYIVLLPLSFLLTAAVQDPAPTPHFVEPGDTWQALAWRFGVTVEVLQAANFNPNSLLEPSIGTTIQIPVGTAAPRPNGRVVRLFEGGLLSFAAGRGLNPWRLAVENGLGSVYRPLHFQPLYIPGDTPLKELPAGFLTLELSSNPPQPGRGIGFRGVRETAEPLAVTLGTQTVNSFANGSRIVGLMGTGAFLSPGDYGLTFVVGDNRLWSQPVRFVAGEWTFSQVTLTGEAAEIDAESIRQERERLFAIWNLASPAPQWTAAFQLPIESYLEISSLFGARRSYNGGPFSSYHEGVDFSAYGGTPVYASAAGTVVIAERLYVRGGAVIIDHGLGIYTGVYHLSEVAAQVGQVVEPGQLVGNVGTTGLSTGNHLHWDLLVGGVWVDAAAWVEQDMACWVLEGWGESCG
jgi:murein DD-endopeptidase MepM/ murein hydrolase activator NlpD